MLNAFIEPISLIKIKQYTTTLETKTTQRCAYEQCYATEYFD